MARYRITKAALNDISAIWEYTVEAWSESQADAYYRMLILSMEKIAIMPTAYGRLYDEVDMLLYGSKAGHHIIFYRVMSNGDILVVRVLHERMDIKNYAY